MQQKQPTWRKVPDPQVEGESLVSALAFRGALIVGIFGGMVVTRWLFPEAPAAKFAVGALLGGALAFLAYHVVSRAIGNNDPLIDWDVRAERWLVIGYGIALSLATVLLVGAFREERRRAENERIAQQERDRTSEMMRSKPFQDGVAAYEKIKELRERAATSRPAGAPAADDDAPDAGQP